MPYLEGATLLGRRNLAKDCGNNEENNCKVLNQNCRRVYICMYFTRARRRDGSLDVVVI